MRAEIGKVAAACRLPGFRYLVFAPPAFPDARPEEAEPVLDAAPAAPEPPPPPAQSAPAPAAPALVAPAPSPAAAQRFLEEVFRDEPAAPPAAVPAAPGRARPRSASAGREAPRLPPRPPRPPGRFALLDEVAGAAGSEEDETPTKPRSASALLAALRREGKGPH